MLVHQRRTRLARLPHVIDRGKLFEIERHGRRNVLGFGTRRRHAHGDEFTNLAHLAGGKVKARDFVGESLVDAFCWIEFEDLDVDRQVLAIGRKGRVVVEARRRKDR